MDMWGKVLRVLKVYSIGKRRAERRRLLEFCDERAVCGKRLVL